MIHGMNLRIDSPNGLSSMAMVQVVSPGRPCTFWPVQAQTVVGDGFHMLLTLSRRPCHICMRERFGSRRRLRILFLFKLGRLSLCQVPHRSFSRLLHSTHLPSMKVMRPSGFQDHVPSGLTCNFTHTNAPLLACRKRVPEKAGEPLTTMKFSRPALPSVEDPSITVVSCGFTRLFLLHMMPQVVG